VPTLASQAREPVKWAERYCGPQVVAQTKATGDVWVELAPAVDDRVVDRLQGGEPQGASVLAELRRTTEGMSASAGRHYPRLFLTSR